MFIKIHHIIPIVLLGLLITFNGYTIEARTNNTVNTFYNEDLSVNNTILQIDHDDSDTPYTDKILAKIGTKN